MNYITIKKVKFISISGEVDLPKGTILECKFGLVKYKGLPLCYIDSQIALDNLAYDGDGAGEKRGEYLKKIRNALSCQDKFHQKRWDKIWADPTANRYRQHQHKDFFLWDTPLISAPVEDLEHIWRLIKDV